MRPQYFESYKNNAISPNLSNSITVYTLKDNFSSEEVHTVANKLGITTFETDTPDYAAAYKSERQLPAGVTEGTKCIQLLNQRVAVAWSGNRGR